jgi:hypothetical protein
LEFRLEGLLGVLAEMQECRIAGLQIGLWIRLKLNKVLTFLSSENST